MVAPLEGIVVLDFSRLLPGPFATQLLANLGADVIKVEQPGPGDYMRAVPPMVQGLSYPFLMVNRGKRSIAVDLKTGEGQEILHRLAVRTDVLVEQFRPGTMRKLRADYETLAALNPRLIYCSFSGFGQAGPSKSLPGHDITFEAMAGILGLTGNRGGHPGIPGVPIADLASGFNAAFAILAALRTRDLTGRGEYVDVSIFDTTIGLMALNLAHFLATGEEPAAGETILTGRFPFYGLYETSDGRWMAVAAVEPVFWRRLCEVLDLPGLVEHQFGDPSTNEDTRKALASRFRTRTLAEWEETFSREELPVAGVRRVSEVLQDPQVHVQGLLPVADIPGWGRTRVLGPLARHSLSEIRTPTRVPSMGQDTAAILSSLGYAPEEIGSLFAKGIIARSSPD